MTGAGLVYLMGPSGSGKDTLLGLLPQLLPAGARVRIARRSITRPADGEASEAVTPDEFRRRAASGEFVLHWHSHGLSYGIGREIDTWLAQGDIVIVNGSREYLPSAHARYPGLTAVSITVDPHALTDRLRGRGRESEAGIQARLARAHASFAVPAGCRHLLIANDDAPIVAARALAALVSEAGTGAAPMARYATG